MPYKITGIGRSRERPTVFIILSSLYSVQLYLVWSQKLHQNALSYPCDSTNAKMRTQNHSHAQVYSNFHFLSFIFTHYLFPFFFISLACAIPLFSLSRILLLLARIHFLSQHTYIHVHTHIYTLTQSQANLIGYTCVRWCKIKPITH